MRKITHHIIHCSDSPNHRDIGVKTIRRWHTEPEPRGNGWSDIGYHYVIRRDGTIELGRPLEIQGAHCKGHNNHSIGTCLVGRDEFTEAQFKSLRRLHKTLKAWLPQIKVAGHRDLNPNKTCPNFDVQEVLA
ncbi:MAG: N-acetylmuramoyl-L-alanine amidase [Alphaproteobacteria bacterium]|nr:N-acetylmuramoyl-L-alanine amidase [Alphaproteobacteria bacterium]MDD9919760.1 N-acetylmuramoyl-L-alanine amidase [Alphaproteobacteria bacterium]